MRLQHIIILQNKVDLVTESAAINQHEAISRFIQARIAQRVGRESGRAGWMLLDGCGRAGGLWR